MGETVDKALELKQQVLDLSHRCEAVSAELDQFQTEVEEYVKQKQYQAASLKLLAKSLRDKRVGVVKSAEDNLELATAAVAFHEDVEKVSVFFVSTVCVCTCIQTAPIYGCYVLCAIRAFNVVCAVFV